MTTLPQIAGNGFTAFAESYALHPLLPNQPPAAIRTLRLLGLVGAVAPVRALAALLLQGGSVTITTERHWLTARLGPPDSSHWRWLQTRLPVNDGLHSLLIPASALATSDDLTFPVFARADGPTTTLTATLFTHLAQRSTVPLATSWAAPLWPLLMAAELITPLECYRLQAVDCHITTTALAALVRAAVADGRLPWPEEA